MHVYVGNTRCGSVSIDGGGDVKINRNNETVR